MWKKHPVPVTFVGVSEKEELQGWCVFSSPQIVAKLHVVYVHVVSEKSGFQFAVVIHKYTVILPKVHSCSIERSARETSFFRPRVPTTSVRNLLCTNWLTQFQLIALPRDLERNSSVFLIP